MVQRTGVNVIVAFDRWRHLNHPTGTLGAATLSRCYLRMVSSEYRGVAPILYSLPKWELTCRTSSRINAFLKRTYKCGFSGKLPSSVVSFCIVLPSHFSDPLPHGDANRHTIFTGYLQDHILSFPKMYVFGIFIID